MKYFDLKVGFSCNNNCVHCVITDKKSTQDLTTERIKEIINTIPVDMVVGFTGGEATIRKDFIELLMFAKDTGHETYLQTNGSMFSDLEFTQEVSKYLDGVLIAIHSHIPEIHNSIVRTHGMYDKTIQGFKNITKLGIDCTTQTVISKLNIDSLLETYDFIQEINPGISMNLTFPHPNGNAWNNRDIVVPRFTEIKDQIQNILKKYSKLLNVEAIPLCYLYPYHNDVFNFDSNILSEEKTAGIDPSNTCAQYFDEEGRTDDYKMSQISEKRKGPRCKECIFNNECVGVWKEYVDIHKDHFDLFPILKDETKCDECLDGKPEILSKWGSLIIYSDSTHCMNRCTFCNGSSAYVEPFLKFDTAIKDIDFLVKSGVNKIEISGGDPGEYGRIVDIVKYIKDCGINSIMLSTHGRTLKDVNLVAQLKEAGLDRVRIPLYGSTEEIHNKTTQFEKTPGNAFTDTIQGIMNCEKNRIEVVGHTILNQYNKTDMNNIIKLYKYLGKELINIIYINVSFIAKLDYEYTGNWFLPIKDMQPYLKDVYNNLPENVDIRFLDIPYCALGEYSDIIENKNNFPNLGQHKVEESNRSIVSDSIPHYRIKSYFNECETCIYKTICSGITLNELKMFGVYGLKGFK